MIKINLNPKKERKKIDFGIGSFFSNIQILKPAINKDIFILAIPIVTFVGIISYTLYLNSKLNELLEKKESLEKQLKVKQSVAKEIDEMKQKFETYKKEKEILLQKIKIYEHIHFSAYGIKNTFLAANNLSNEKISFIIGDFTKDNATLIGISSNLERLVNLENINDYSVKVNSLDSILYDYTGISTRFSKRFYLFSVDLEKINNGDTQR